MTDGSRGWAAGVAGMCILLAAALQIVTLASEDYRLVLAAASVALAIGFVMLVRVYVQRAPRLWKNGSVIGIALILLLAADIVRRVPDTLRALGPGEVFLLPDRSVGWIRVVYGVKGSPLLAREGESRVISVSTSGEVITSEKSMPAKLADRFYYDRDGTRIPAPVAMRDGPRRTRAGAEDERCIFIGGMEDMRQLVASGVPVCKPGLRRVEPMR